MQLATGSTIERVTFILQGRSRRPTAICEGITSRPATQNTSRKSNDTNLEPIKAAAKNEYAERLVHILKDSNDAITHRT